MQVKLGIFALFTFCLDLSRGWGAYFLRLKCFGFIFRPAGKCPTRRHRRGTPSALASPVHSWKKYKGRIADSCDDRYASNRQLIGQTWTQHTKENLGTSKVVILFG
ncbi:hypothetical protein, partial [Microcoleus sp. PH2017_28_MFU_U_A]|uniref:hypothetical protein n=1 Tax=Microcoleus sp. PH2017_28_MFU_U_A TaxID=2798838 RepID=UPI002D7F3585